MLLSSLVNEPDVDVGDLRCLDLLLRAAEHHDYSVRRGARVDQPPFYFLDCSTRIRDLVCLLVFYFTIDLL